MQAMNKLVESLGAFAVSVGTAAKPDWGRSIVMSRSDPAEWQWFKRFMSTVRGCQRAFWLPTFREDLLAVGDGPGGGTSGEIVIDETYGDYLFWATDHTRLMVVQNEQTYYVRITESVDNLDGTRTLQVSTDGDTIPDAGPIDMLSWLELCHLESDTIAVEFRGATFTVKTTARAVQQ
jgi:hypothetical protein